MRRTVKEEDPRDDLCVLFCLASGRRVSDLCENATRISRRERDEDAITGYTVGGRGRADWELSGVTRK